MKKFFHSRPFYIGLSLFIIIIVIIMARGVSTRNSIIQVTTTVDIGTVRELVSVSGIAEAEQIANLAFPVTGIVESVQVSTGDQVEKGDVLITLNSRALYADRQDALASLSLAVASKNELLSGPTGSAREVTAETLATKQTTLTTTKETEAQKVSNAYQTLLSSGLTSYSLDTNVDSLPPVITGTYSCAEEGIYVLDIYSSGANSGYSYNLTGLENDTQSVSTQQPGPLGSCGLRIQFDSNSKYSRSQWVVDIPNTKSTLYITNRNAHSLAITQAESAITLAEQAVVLASADATNQNAPARSEAVVRADASIAQARAQLSRIDSTIADRSLTAPFAGVITEIDILPGETVTTDPVLTLLASDEFEVTARIPEIDIGKLLIGQKVEMVFDAKIDEVLTGEIEFISLKSTEIDGVAYYEAIIDLEEIPLWIRSGLNADIEIVIKEDTDGLRIPKRYVTATETANEVLVQKDGVVFISVIEIVLEGNDGFVSIAGLSEGDIVVAP